MLTDEGRVPACITHRLDCGKPDTSAGFYVAAWLAVAASGRWMRPAEIIAAIPPEIDVEQARSLLWHMAERHGMLATRGRMRTREYAVTRECVTPKGLRVGQVLDTAGAHGVKGGA